MDEKCLEQYYTYYECCLTSNIITLSQFSNFQNLGLKYHLPRLQSFVILQNNFNMMLVKDVPIERRVPKSCLKFLIIT